MRGKSEKSERAEIRPLALPAPRTGLWLGSGFRPSAATGDGGPGHPARAAVAEIRLLRAASRVGVIETHHCALSFTDFGAAAVAYQNGLSSHQQSSLFGSPQIE
jgi:hypothetical protein